MGDVTLMIDDATGAILVEAPDHVAPDLLDALAGVLGPGREMGCARPPVILPPPIATDGEIATSPCVRVAGYYHNSLVEGPGRRSAALFQYCPLACKHCWVPHLHDPRGGALVPVERLAKALLDPAYRRDGVSLLGGEPFAQPDGLLALVRALRAHGCPHILCYSGYTYEALCRRARRQPAIGAVLAEIDMLIDGPFVARLADSAGPWTGSGNQRVLALTRGGATPWAPPGGGGHDSAVAGDARDEEGRAMNEPTARERALLLRLAARWRRRQRATERAATAWRRRSRYRTGQAAWEDYVRWERLEGEALVLLMRYRAAHPAVRDIDYDTGIPLPGHGP